MNSNRVFAMLAAALLCAGSATQAQDTPAPAAAASAGAPALDAPGRAMPALVPWEPPRGTYDVPVSFMKPLKSVGETYEMEFGSYQSNGWKRQVRLKLIGLEQLNRLTQLGNAVRDAQQPAPAANPPASAAEGSESTASRLGGMFGRLLGGASREVAQAREAAKDELVVRMVEAGSPQDAAGSVLADVMVPPGHGGGSVFGIKINNKIRITVTAEDFKPRLLLMRHKPKSLFDGGVTDQAPEYLVIGSTEIEDEGETKMTLAHDSGTKPADGTRGGVLIVVTSADGKAVAGKYKIRYNFGK